MSAVIQDAIVEIATATVAGLSLASGRPIVRQQRMERINWRALMQELELGDGAGLPTPYVVLQIGRHRAAEIAALDMPEFDVPVSVFLIKSNRDDSLETLEINLETLRDSHFNVGHAFTKFQILEDPEIDTSAENEANQIFLQDNHALIAGSISFLAHVQP